MHQAGLGRRTARSFTHSSLGRSGQKVAIRVTIALHQHCQVITLDYGWSAKGALDPPPPALVAGCETVWAIASTIALRTYCGIPAGPMKTNYLSEL